MLSSSSTATMKAVAFRDPGPIEREDALIDVTLPIPKVTGRDILVQVKAVSVNPVDTKVRKGMIPKGPFEERVLGFDGAGIIAQVGDQVENSALKPGVEVYYSGSVLRQGTNSQYSLVDERIVGLKPASLNFAEAAALPLTTITAWEMLFDRLKVTDPTPEGGDTCLIIGGAGGVGSIAIQLLKALASNITIVATASRDETRDWVQSLGAHHVINHRQPMAPQLAALKLTPGFVFSTTHTEDHLNDIIELMPPQGRFGLIDDATVLNAMPFKKKSISLHWELMFTRPIFETPDMAAQAKLLNDVAKLVEQGKIKTTATFTAGKINAETLKKCHEVVESNKAKGKIVLEGF